MLEKLRKTKLDKIRQRISRLSPKLREGYAHGFNGRVPNSTAYLYRAGYHLGWKQQLDRIKQA